MATSAERMTALRERARRGVRRLTIEVSEEDLRAIAKRGYEGAVTTDHDAPRFSRFDLPRCRTRGLSTRRATG
jgi:hypothetical protein